jgi:hypothetical protein
MSYIKTGDVENKISAGSLNNGTVRIGEFRLIGRIWTCFFGWIFQRRFREGEVA